LAAPKARVLVTHWVHPEAIDRLSGTREVIANPTRDTWPRGALNEPKRG
jgi:hypothetical protein